MKNFRPILAICTIIIIFCSFTATEWVDLKSPDGKFAMKFPRKPTPQSQVVKDGPHITLHMYVYDASKYKDDNLGYVMMYCDYPKDMVSSDFRDEIVDTILNGSISGMAENMQGKIISTEKAGYKDYPGKKVKLSVQDGKGFAYVKIYLIGSRMYMFEVMCEPKTDHNASIDKFFDSFTLIDSKPGAPKSAAKH